MANVSGQRTDFTHAFERQLPISCGDYNGENCVDAISSSTKIVFLIEAREAPRPLFKIQHGKVEDRLSKAEGRRVLLAEEDEGAL